MDADINELIIRMHDTLRKAVVAVTGGGACAIAWLLAVPGASRTVLEAVVPYDQYALDDWLGRPPDSYCSAETARCMAKRARERAAWLMPGEAVAGVSCTASIRSDRPKKGDHRVHVAAAGEEGVTSWSLTLTKEQRDREGEDAVAGRMVVNALAEAVGLTQRLSLGLVPGEEVMTQSEEPGLLARFASGSLEAVCIEPDGRMHAARPANAVLVAGSFNPLHHGHLGMAEVAARRTGRPVAFELSIANPDKGRIDLEQLRRRAGQFAWRAPLWLTHAATFDRKAVLFPNAVFVVGADTAARIVQTRFYGDSVETMRQALAAIRASGCRFLVAGRSNERGEFVALEALAIPAEFADLFEGIPAEEFRADVSSTTLRGGRVT